MLKKNSIPAAVWYEKAAIAIARNGKNLFAYANENDLGLTSKECEAIAKSPEFLVALRLERNKFYKELATDPARSRNTAVGQLLYAVERLMDGGQYDKAVTAITSLMKAEGWTTEGAQISIFNDLNAKDIDGLRKKLKGQGLNVEGNTVN